MAEMRNLTFSVEIKGAAELGEALTKSVEKAISTFSEFSKLLDEIVTKLKASGSENITLFGINFDILKDKTGSLKELSEAIQFLKNSFVEQNKDIITTIANLITGLSNLITRINEISPLFIEYYTLMLAVGAAISAVVVAIAGVITAVKVLGTALTIGAGPLGLIILALTGIVTATILVIRYWDEISAFASEVWGGVTNVINTVVTGIMGLFEWLVNGIRDLWNGLISYLEENVPFAGRIFDAIRSDAEDTRQKNEALFNSIRESQKNNQPAILGFQQPGQNFAPQQQVMTQVNLHANALNNQAVATRESTESIKEQSVVMKENEKAHEGAKGKVDEHSGALTNFGTSGRAVINPIEQLNDGLRNQITELQNQIEAVGKSGDELLELEAKQKLAEGASEDLVARWKELEKALDVAKKQEEFIGSIEDLIEKTKEERETLGLTGEELREYKIRALEAKLSTEEFTEDGLKKAQEGLVNLREETEKFNTAELAKKFEDMQFSLLPESEQERMKLEETLAFLDDFAEKRKNLEQEVADVRVQVIEDANERIQELERKEYIERLKESGSFTDGLKAGFLEFVDQVENNSELVSQFFADTLSQMSQNFSDLFFNIITGKFKDLADLAKQAFEAILRAFLDMVAAIATRQIVISIAGALGVNTKGAKATDVIGLGKDAVDLAGSAIGAGGTAASAIGSIGSSGITLGSDTLLFGSSAGSLGLAGETLSTSGGNDRIKEMEYQMAA